MICSKCKLDKTEENFASDPTRKRGRNYWCRVCINKRQKEYRPRYAEYYKRRHLKRTYGLEYEDYLNLSKAQDNRCAICNEIKPLVVDHNHQTGLIRGLLCNFCNQGLGLFKDNSTILRNAAKYVKT